ncbi:sensor histidine kinase [Agromyces archimandritae]|uniref:histidine kinase n=1 Tax=Agromyces archimandritae TaxID=2781962 RepID=A0A975FMZ7_9MICO|nr:sensor histidine kinase [Agromyces archimandritae]QTX05125.1 sensor histidine kinase [Agromyces archimandritae]
MPVPMWDEPPRRRPGPPRAVLLLVPVVVSLLVQLPAAIGIGLWRGESAPTIAWQAALAAAGPLALLAVQWMPGPTVAVVAAAALADLLLAPDLGPPYIALAFAIVIAVARGAIVWALAATGAVWLAALLAGPLLGLDWHPARIAATTLALAVCFATGAFVRVRGQRAAAYRAAAERRRADAEDAERTRIAAELHDVLGHSLSLIAVQANAGLHVIDADPAKAKTMLANIKAASRTALGDMRTVLGALRDEEAPLVPQRELADLAELVQGVRAAGIDVRLDDTLEEHPPRAVQSAAYRIVQEALTNVLRHAGAGRAEVRVAADGPMVRVTVDDDGRGLPVGAEGAGLLGMRGRAELLGGEVRFEPSPLGGTRVLALLPGAEAA